VDVAVASGQRGSKRVRHRGMIPLIPLTRQERPRWPKDIQGDQGGQGVQVTGDEHLGVVHNDHYPGERCIHEVPGGCCLCNKKSGAWT
jgi:hypothetical protein